MGPAGKSPETGAEAERRGVTFGPSPLFAQWGVWWV